PSGWRRCWRTQLVGPFPRDIARHQIGAVGLLKREVAIKAVVPAATRSIWPSAKAGRPLTIEASTLVATKAPKLPKVTRRPFVADFGRRCRKAAREIAILAGATRAS